MRFDLLFQSMPLSFWVLFAGLLILLAWCYIAEGDAKVKGGKHRVKNGTLGNASFADEKELSKEYKTIKFDPQSWRKGKDLPTEPGLLLGNWHTWARKVNHDIPFYIDKKGNWHGGNVFSRLFTEDQDAAMVAAAGSGKTSFVLAAQLEYNLACGIPILTTDTKGDIVDKWAPIARDKYGYNVINFDLGHPLRANRFNIIGSVNKYVDKYKACPDKKSEEALGYLAKAESYAKAVAKTIIMQGTDGNYGANSFFYDSAEGLLQAVILLVSEYAEQNERHILSVYNVIQQISGTEMINGVKTSQVKVLLDQLPEDSKIRLFAGSAAQGGDSQASVVSTAMSRLLSFLDSEIETMLCGDSELDVEEFAKNKTIIFLTVPEEQETRYFMVSLIVQEVYNELLEISREHGNKVPVPKGFNGKPGHQRIEFLLDEIGTLPPIKGMDKILSAGRSRRIFVLNIVQSTSQLEKNYGKTNSEIILANSKLIFVAGLAPLSSDIPRISKVLGKYTVETNSSSTSSKPTGGSSRSRSVQMTAIDLMSETEIQQDLGLGKVLIIRSGQKPILSHFDLFLDWGIDLSAKPIDFPSKRASDVRIANKDKIIQAIGTSKQKQEGSPDMQKATEIMANQKQMEAEEKAKKDAKQSEINSLDMSIEVPEDPEDIPEGGYDGGIPVEILSQNDDLSQQKESDEGELYSEEETELQQNNAQEQEAIENKNSLEEKESIPVAESTDEEPLNLDTSLYTEEVEEKEKPSIPVVTIIYPQENTESSDEARTGAAVIASLLDMNLYADFNPLSFKNAEDLNENSDNFDEEADEDDSDGFF